MERTHLPAAWASTANSLEYLAFLAKDALLVIDDFAPQGSATDVARYHAAADRVFRGAGNHAGRGRLDSSARLRESKPPRCLIISTGEEIPRGHSVRARLMLLELSKGEITSEQLTGCQADAHAGLYVGAMSAFISWAASDFETTAAKLKSRVFELTRQAQQGGCHARTPMIVANLQAGFEFFLEFAISCDAVGKSERDQLAADCWAALTEVAAAQQQQHIATEPTAMYISCLRTLLISGRAHLRDRDGRQPDDAELCGWRNNGNAWTAGGESIGWVDGADIFIEASAAYREVQRTGRDVGDALNISEQTLKKRLQEKGRLAPTDTARQTLTVRRKLAGHSIPVLHFHRETIFPTEDESLGSRRNVGFNVGFDVGFYGHFRETRHQCCQCFQYLGSKMSGLSGFHRGRETSAISFRRPYTHLLAPIVLN